MTAVVAPSVGARWELQRVPRPEPGVGEVLLRVLASGVCVNDVASTAGHLPFPSCEPAVPGHEVVGEIQEVGPDVAEEATGAIVGLTWVRRGCGHCRHCQASPEATGATALLCEAPITTGFSHQGGHAEYIVAHVDDVVPIPTGMDPASAAAVLCAGYTAWSALKTAAPAPGDRVAVQSLGSIGHMAAQYALALGHEVTVLTQSQEKQQTARELGAHALPDATQLQQEGGADVIICTGPDYELAASALPALKLNGRLILTGIDGAAGFDIPPVASWPFFVTGQSVTGATHGGRQHLEEALAMSASGRAEPFVQRYPLSAAAEVQQLVASGSVRFRAVFEP